MGYRLFLTIAIVFSTLTLGACKVSYDYSTPSDGGGYTGSQD